MKTAVKSATRKERLKELIWFICRNYGQELFETKLWKLVFLSDADFYEKYNETITGVPYIKNTHGPTPSYKIAKGALEDLIKGGYITKSKDGIYSTTNDLGLNYLDDQKIDAIKSTCERYYKLNTREICLLTHRDPVFLGAEKNNDLLDFSLVRYRDDDQEFENEDDKFEKIKFSKRANEALLKVLKV